MKSALYNMNTQKTPAHTRFLGELSMFPRQPEGLLDLNMTDNAILRNSVERIAFSRAGMVTSPCYYMNTEDARMVSHRFHHVCRSIDSTSSENPGLLYWQCEAHIYCYQVKTEAPQDAFNTDVFRSHPNPSFVHAGS
jgi:hypothetical protein